MGVKGVVRDALTGEAISDAVVHVSLPGIFFFFWGGAGFSL